MPVQDTQSPKFLGEVCPHNLPAYVLPSAHFCLPSLPEASCPPQTVPNFCTELQGFPNEDLLTVDQVFTLWQP